jgi:putative aldouronate transport system substrate-binding protein
MKNKRLFSILLTSIILLLQFTGCSRTKSDEAIKNVDKEIKPLKFSMSMGTSRNQYCVSVPDINNDKWVLELNKRANINLNLRLLDYDRFHEQIKLMFASGDIPDVVWSFGDWKDIRLKGAVDSGVFMPVDQLLTENKEKLKNLMKTIPEQAWEESITDFDGKIYNIPVGYLSIPALNGTFIRQDLLEKYELKAPTNLDEAVDVLKAFKKGGLEYPYVGREKWAYTTTFLEPFGVAINRWNFNDKGELVPDIIRPEMKEALAFHAMLVREGLMDPSFLTTSGYSWSNKIQSGRMGGIFTHQVQGLREWNSGIKANIPEGQFALVPAVAGPKGAKGSIISPTIWSSVLINKNFKEPLRFLEFLDWTTTDDAQEFFTFGIEGEDYSKKDGRIQFEFPSDIYKISENHFRKMLSPVVDQSYNKMLIPFIPGGDEMLDFLHNVSPKEGYHAYKTEGRLNALKEYPNLNPEDCDLFFEYAAKIVLGKIPVDDFDKFVAEYLRRGGNKLIKEQNQWYKEGKIREY